jgi:hypothetical protein
MTRILVTAQVEDGAKWEEGFRTHGALFKSMTATSVHYAVMDDNHVAVYTEVDDQAKYFEVMDSDATAEAMAHDGVKRDTVKIFLLDKEIKL